MTRVTTRPTDFSPEKWWRPKDRRGPICGYTLDDLECRKRGAHWCEPRAVRVRKFFRLLLVHTKGPFARTRFELTDWQWVDIIAPLFGEVVWSQEWQRYVRRYRIAYIVVARKNGKSELAAGILLYLLVGDDEESAEVYGAAKDTKQAGKVFEPAWRMVQLSVKLRKRLKLNKHARRIFDEKTSSHYEVITADALGELGHNPHGFCLDEVLSQPDDSLWTAMRTAAGARTQQLLLCCTTETNLPDSFGATLIDEAERVQADPTRAPHIFSYVRKTPSDADPWDERNWPLANPALGDFLSYEALRQEALEAKLDPSKLNPFKQFRLNQRVAQVTRFITPELWQSCMREVAPNPEWVAKKLEGQRCYGGLDLSAISDLTAWCLVGEDGWAWWRYWITEATFEELTPLIPNLVRWRRDGWLTVTEGDVIDYEKVYEDIRADGKRFNIVRACYDKWSAEPARQRIDAENKFELLQSATNYEHMSQPMKELKRVLKAQELAHGGNPVSAWHANSMDSKSPPDDPDRMRPVKPNRGKHDKRNDGMITLLLAIDARVRFPEAKKAKPMFAWG